MVQLREMKRKETAKKVEDGAEETLTDCGFPSEHWTQLRTNNVIERDVVKALEAKPFCSNFIRK